MNRKLLILTKNWARHGNFSGYEKIIEHFSFKLKTLTEIKLPFQLKNFLKKKTKLVNYRSQNVAVEFLVLFKFFSRKTVHILYADMDYYFLHLLKYFPFNLRKNTLIATFHHPPGELNKRLLYNRDRVLGALDKIIVMGPNQIPYFKSYCDAQIKFIPHGIDTSFFNYSLDEKRKDQILIIGISHRDHERNINIIKRVAEQVDVVFKVIVTPEVAVLYRDLKNVEINIHKVSDNELLTYYRESKGMLLSLKDCTASNSILEALACGCPIIINNVGAVKDYIPEESGVPVYNSDEIEQSVTYILNLLKDDNLIHDIGIKQRALSEKYDWRIIAKETEDFILQ